MVRDRSVLLSLARPMCVCACLCVPVFCLCACECAPAWVCLQACLELSYTVVTPLVDPVTLGGVCKIMDDFLALVLAVSALATSNWVCSPVCGCVNVCVCMCVWL